MLFLFLFLLHPVFFPAYQVPNENFVPVGVLRRAGNFVMQRVVDIGLPQVCFQPLHGEVIGSEVCESIAKVPIQMLGNERNMSMGWPFAP